MRPRDKWWRLLFAHPNAVRVAYRLRVLVRFRGFALTVLSR
jgi:hypothetical protein